MQKNEPVDEKIFDSNIKEWEWNWVNGHEPYAAQPKGDAVKTAAQLFKKYQHVIAAAYH
jgi:alpha-N-acetylglucosaminidase